MDGRERTRSTEVCEDLVLNVSDGVMGGFNWTGYIIAVYCLIMEFAKYITLCCVYLTYFIGDALHLRVCGASDRPNSAYKAKFAQTWQ